MTGGTDGKVTDWVRRSTAVPTLRFFRMTNFELYSKYAECRPGSGERVSVATVLACGLLVTHTAFSVRGCLPCALPPGVLARTNLAVAVPGTAIFLGVVAYFAMLKSDVAQLEKEQAQRQGRETQR